MAKLAHLRLVHCFNWLIDAVHQLHSGVRNPRDHRAPVFFAALANNPSARFHTVQQSRDVGIPSQQPLAYLRTGGARRFSSAQYSQHVVLHWRKVKCLQEVRENALDDFRRSHHVENRFLLDSREGPGLLQFRLESAGHKPNIFVITTIVKRCF